MSIIASRPIGLLSTSLTALTLLALVTPVPNAAGDDRASPLSYAPAKAYHILPETHSSESGYESLSVGHNGRIYVGTAKYNVNAYLVEFDPDTEQQRIVIDTHAVGGIGDIEGMQAQAKIHTRNYVASTGEIYVGSKQGYAREGQSDWDYPAGYVMVYDPASDTARKIAKLPYHAHGVGDVMVDEQRELIYIATQQDATRTCFWALYDMRTEQFRTIGPPMTFYATTWIDNAGVAHAITADFQIASYDPDADRLTLRPMMRDGERWFEPTRERRVNPELPNWTLAPDGRHAYMLIHGAGTLYRIDLQAEGDAIEVENFGPIMESEETVRTFQALAFGPDGRFYALVRAVNETDYGPDHLHHLVRYDPASERREDLGVVAVTNPDFFDFGPDADGQRPPWSHGYATLPDGLLTPTVSYHAMLVTDEGDIYATALYPFTLLRFEPVPMD